MHGRIAARSVRTAVAIVWVACTPLFAVSYAIRGATGSSVTVGFSLSKSEISGIAGQSSFVLAVAASQSQSPSLRVVPDSSLGGPSVILPVQEISKGWAGSAYLHWFSFSASRRLGNGPISAVEKGNIIISASGMSSAQRPFVKNGIVYTGVQAALAKALSFPQPGAGFSTGVKILVGKDGIYQIKGSDLKRLGVPTSSLSSSAYKLRVAGIEVPLYISNNFHPTLQDNDLILFYGQSLRGATTYMAQFSNTNVYWLSWEGGVPGVRVAEASGAQRKDITVYSQGSSTQILAHDFLDTVHLEQDNLMLFLGNAAVAGEMSDSMQNADPDDWYWGIIGQNAITTFQIDVPSPTLSTDPTLTARLHIRLQGMSNVQSISPNHQLYVYLNDNMPGGLEQVAQWNGQTKFDFTTSQFPSSLLKNGSNTITFSRVPLGSGQQAQSYPDLSALNWIEVEYSRTFTADSNQLVFKNSGSDVNGVYQFSVKGFSSNSLDLWDIGNFRLFTGFSTQSATAGGKTSFTLVFQDSLSAVRKYLAQTVSNRLVPARMVLDTIPGDWTYAAQADYVVVTVDSFFNDFKPFVDAYAKKGVSVALADISKIYDSFSHGICDPDAICAFLRHIFSLSPSKHPRYLLLAGDTTHDLDKANRQRNIVPTHLSRVPGWGPASDDGYFASFLGNEDFPDINIGRFPAENRAELQNIVSKTVGYLSQRPCGPWHDNLLLLGGAENNFTVFNDNTQTEIIGPAMNVYRLDGDPQSPYYRDESRAATDLAGLVNAGVYAINFDGHGGGLVWSDSKFFSYTDLDKLYNGQWGSSGRLPIIFSLTCLTGDFESSDYPSLGEEFLRLKKNGTVGFFGASGYTSATGNLIMNRMLLDNAVNGSFESVGDLLSFVKMNMLVSFGSEYVALVREYNFLGDPALPWALAPDSLKLAVGKSAMRPQDTLSIRGSCVPVLNGQARVTVGADLAAWNQFVWDVRNDSLHGVCPVKDSLKTSRGVVRALAWNDSQDLRGYATFSKSAVLFKNVAVFPSPLHFGDSVTVSSNIEILDTSHRAQAVICLYSATPRYAASPTFTGVPMFADSTGAWKTGARIPVVFNGMVGENLLAKFRVVGNGVSDTTDVYSFDILGRPDVMFTQSGLTLGWRNDSLCAFFGILNGGNAAAGPFSIAIFGNPDGQGTAMAAVTTKDSLMPGKSKMFAVCLPDTQGTFRLTAVANQPSSFEEISRGNNSAGCNVRLKYADLSAVSDTLRSAARAVCVSPLSRLSPVRRVFLSADTMGALSPLRTESYWTPLLDDSISRWSAWTRPALSPSDSLVWVFHRLVADTAVPSAKRATPYPAAARLRVLAFDSLLNAWRSAPGSVDSADMACVIHSSHSGPLAPGLITDNQAPHIQVSVDGRNLTFLDYAAKGKPFNLFLSDASGIVPSSVRVLLDNKSFDSALVSRIPVQTDMREVSCTAYPKKESNVDSITVIAEDYAGNQAATTFAYYPGEDLAIKSFSCHPNPFAAKQDNAGRSIQTIRFAFLLTDVAQSASIVIYTIGNRVVWSWQNSNGIIGYQEVPWDGKTSQGYRIANGTYYAKLTVKNSSKSASSIITIAKLEGY